MDRQDEDSRAAWDDALVTQVYDPVVVEEPRDGRETEWLTRPCLVLLAPEAGILEISSADVRVRIGPGEVGITPPKAPVRFRYHATDGAPMRYRWMPVTARLWGGIDLFALLDPPVSLSGADADAVVRAFDRLGEPPAGPHPFTAPLHRQSVATELLTIVTSRSAARPDALDVLERAREIAPVLRAMRDNLASPLDVDDLARIGHMSPASVHRKFTAVFGTPPMSYLKALRLDEAAQLLFRTDDPIADVAHRVGFPNAFHFSREFRARFAVPPSVYRERVRRHLLGERPTPTALTRESRGGRT